MYILYSAVYVYVFIVEENPRQCCYRYVRKGYSTANVFWLGIRRRTTAFSHIWCANYRRMCWGQVRSRRNRLISLIESSYCGEQHQEPRTATCAVYDVEFPIVIAIGSRVLEFFPEFYRATIREVRDYCSVWCRFVCGVASCVHLELTLTFQELVPIVPIIMYWRCAGGADTDCCSCLFCNLQLHPVRVVSNFF